MYNSNFRLSPSAIFCLHILFMCHNLRIFILLFSYDFYNYHKFGVNTIDFILSQFQKPEVLKQCQWAKSKARAIIPEGSRESFLRLFKLLVAAGSPWLMATTSLQP